MFKLKILLGALFLVAVSAALMALFFVQDDWQAETLKETAEMKWSEQDYLGAVRDYEKLVEHHPKSPWVAEAHYWKAVALSLYLEDVPGGILAFEASLRRVGIDPVLALKNHASLAEIYQKQIKDPRKAIAALESIAEISASSAEVLQARYQIGGLYFEMGEMVQARVEWDLLILLAEDQNKEMGAKSGSAESKNWIGKALYRKAGSYFVRGQCEPALRIYQALYRQFPKHEMALFAKFRSANCLEMTDRPEEALPLYEELKANYPDTALIVQKITLLQNEPVAP